MVDVFGGSGGFQAPRGPRGPRGIPGTIEDLCEWLPQTTLKNLQENEEVCCLFIEDPTKDIKRKGSGIQQWINRSHSNPNLTAERASKDIIQVSEHRYALAFKKNRYISDDLLFIPNHSGTYGFICVTFQTSENHKQVILSNVEKENEYFHEIYVTSTEIYICGRENEKPRSLIIQHSNYNWTTLFLEYTAMKNVTKFNYIINNDPQSEGSFTFDTYHEMYSGVAVGSRYDDTRFLQGNIASIEIYHVRGQKSMPQCLKNIVIKNHLIKI